MTQPPVLPDRSQYDALMEVIRNRMTVRAFDPSYAVPREHYELILEAARHSPSGANAQPWHFIVITDADLKTKITEYFREEQVARAKLKMKFPTPDYRGLATAPAMKPLLGIPDELSVLDIMCFGPAAKQPYKRWKKSLAEITNWNRFDPAHYMTEAQIDDWVATTRHKVMYRDAGNVD